MSADIPITSEDVAEIATILDKTAYDRLEITTGRFTLRVSRTGESWSQELSWRDAAAAAAPAPEAGVAAVGPDGARAIRPPLPGVFYRAPQPGAPPFVEVGDRVAPDTVVGIIETMKLMTSVPAGCSGEVQAIVAQNGGAVDAESVLMWVRPDAA
jgi:acetyl-CoA carboxylase biotin carboxyl carrier protein